MDKQDGSFSQYIDCLKLDALLSARQPMSDNPDELHFILIHQIHELLFKLALHPMERLRAALHSGDLGEGVRLAHQVSAIFKRARGTVEHLHTLLTIAFHASRMLLVQCERVNEGIATA